MKSYRKASVEHDAHCTTCNAYSRGPLVYLQVRTPGYRAANLWLCPACTRHVLKVALRVQRQAT